MKKIFSLLAAAAFTFGCQTSQPEVRYTTIEATLAQAIKFGNEVVYAKQIFRYPQISGMKNKAAQDSLNYLFMLVDIAQLRADSSYINIHQLSDSAVLEHGRMYSHDKVTVHYVDNNLISYSGMMEFNGGAHPSFVLHHGKTLAVATLTPIRLDDLFTGDYKTFFKQQIAASKQFENFTSDGVVTLDEFGSACYDMLDALLQQMDSVTTTANMVITDSAVNILQIDFRDFGCPEFMRDVVEVSIPYALLKPYINSKSYLNRFITKNR
jgi:hypothetical protein